MKLQITSDMLRHDILEMQSALSNNPSNEISYAIEGYTLALTMLSHFPIFNSDKLNTLTLADVIGSYIGFTEKDKIYETIQRWYYGSFVKGAWCATGLSWALSKMGLLVNTCSHKYENVYLMYNGFLEAGTREISSIQTATRGDVIFFKWEDDFGISTRKHVAVFTGKTSEDYVYVVGCNQNNSICVKSYNKKSIVAIFRPDYTKSTLKSLEDLTIV